MAWLKCRAAGVGMLHGHAMLRFCVLECCITECNETIDLADCARCEELMRKSVLSQAIKVSLTVSLLSAPPAAGRPLALVHDAACMHAARHSICMQCSHICGPQVSPSHLTFLLHLWALMPAGRSASRGTVSASKQHCCERLLSTLLPAHIHGPGVDR